jgi:hypothetical protein
MPVRKYWRHMLGINVALYLADEPRDRKVAFVNHICETQSDAHASELVESRNKLVKSYNEFIQTKLTI